MPDQPTPGQIAYEAYWQTWNEGLPPQLSWEQIIPDNKRAWEAAAQAVLARATREEKETP